MNKAKIWENRIQTKGCANCKIKQNYCKALFANNKCLSKL